MMVKDVTEKSMSGVYEKWNSYSRIRALYPELSTPPMWGPSPKMPLDIKVPMSWMNIDGAAGTSMFHYDGTRQSIDFLKYDLVGLAYRFPASISPR